MTFTITNPSDQEAEVSILGKLKNPVNRGTEQRCLRNRLTAEKGCAQIVMKSDSQKPNASNGSLAWSVSADEVSWILGEFAPYFTNYEKYLKKIKKTDAQHVRRDGGILSV